MRSRAVSIIYLVATLVCNCTANAAVIMTLEQVGPNVVATGSGTVDLTNLTFAFAGAGTEMYPAFALLTVGTPTDVPLWDFYTSVGGPAYFGTGGPAVASTGSGDRLAIYGLGAIAVPQGYISGTPLYGTASYDNTTLAALGVRTGIYKYSGGSGAHADSLTLYIGVPAPIPEPASALLLALGTGGLAVITGVIRIQAS